MNIARLLILSFFAFFLSSQSFAQDLRPFIDFLRQTPAFVNGTVYFNADSVLFDDGWTQVKLLKNQPVEFTFKENYLEVRARSAFYVKSYKLRVYVESVSWSPKTGIQSKSSVPADFTGLSRSYVSGKVAEALKELFEQRIIKANNHLKRIRTQRTVGSIFEIAKTIVKIFTASYGDGGSNIYIPKYRGEIGLNILPPKAAAFNLYGMRVGIKERDYYRSGFKFTGDTNGIYPYAVELYSRDGVDANYGKEFKIASRLVLKNVKISSAGTSLEMHLGASEIVAGILTLAERAAQTRNPGARCENCAELASFPGVRARIEKQVREAIVTQVDELWPMMQGLNISPQIYTSFKKKESCRIRGMSCVQRCSNRGEESACKQQCQQTMNACLR